MLVGLTLGCVELLESAGDGPEPDLAGVVHRPPAVPGPAKPEQAVTWGTTA